MKPHCITEGTVQYQLGEIINNVIEYDFKSIKIYLNDKGKILFGKSFKLYQEDEGLLYKLCCYFVQDHQACANLGIDTNKGLLLSGPVGCGKTTIMKLLPLIVPNKKAFEIIPTRNIIFNFNANGYKVLEPYSEQYDYCFDDLGVEATGCHFGKECNVMGEILLLRYDLFCATSRSQSQSQCHPERPDKFGGRILTHLTQTSTPKNSKNATETVLEAVCVLCLTS